MAISAKYYAKLSLLSLDTGTIGWRKSCKSPRKANSSYKIHGNWRNISLFELSIQNINCCNFLHDKRSVPGSKGAFHAWYGQPRMMSLHKDFLLIF